ncbi:SsrA-binding protein [Roseovarius sp.]|uniref:SsrA-binding protein n=1 Tax=Roseovarius sp. TaxID=1486281 RepID=UPI003A97C808
MELLIALFTGATVGMIAAGLWHSSSLGWLLHAMIGGAGGALGLFLFSLAPPGVIAALTGGGDVGYLLRVTLAAALCGLASVWLLGTAAQMLRR